MPASTTLPLPQDLIDVSAAARLLGVHVSAVYRWIAAKKLAAWRVGGRWRLSRADVIGFVRRSGPGEPEGGAARKAVPSQAEARELLRRAGMIG